MLDAVLKLVPLDVEYSKEPLWYIVPDQDSGVVVETNPVWDGIKETVAKYGYDPACIGTLERMKFYEKAGEASVTICTSETQPYGCIILKKGVK
jgi:L-fucose mutarotase